MTKYQKITDISLVTDTISIYRESRYLKFQYDTDTDISISAMYRRYFRYTDPPLIQYNSLTNYWMRLSCSLIARSTVTVLMYDIYKTAPDLTDCM